ncbi:MAG: hypothetical protein AAGJ35_05445, partial [Myxococcota bacterium]
SSTKIFIEHIRRISLDIVIFEKRRFAVLSLVCIRVTQLMRFMLAKALKSTVHVDVCKRQSHDFA